MPQTSLADTHTGITADILRQLRRRQIAASASQQLIWEDDTFTITGSGDTAHTLSWIPYGINVALLNGLGLVEGTDYTADYTTGVVTLSATLTAGDVLHVRYVTTGELKVFSTAPDLGFTVYDDFNRADSTTTVNPASDGGAWTQDGAAWGITSNRAYSTGSTTGRDTTIVWMEFCTGIRRDLGATAFDITAVGYQQPVSGTTLGGLMGSVNPTNKAGYGMRLGYSTLSAATTVDLGRLETDGSWGGLTSIYTTTFDPAATPVTWRFTHDGAGNLAAYLNGTLILSFADSGFLSFLGTWVGAMGGGTFMQWDSFGAS